MALSMEAGTSLSCFLVAGTSFFLSLLFNLNESLAQFWHTWWLVIFLAYISLVHLLLRVILNTRDAYAVGVRGGILGSVFGFGLIISKDVDSLAWNHFGWYVTCLSIFHWSEFFTTALTNPKSLTLESYLLDHSKEYKVAAVASWTEFCIEWLIFPGLKQLRYISLVGFFLVIIGEVVRKASMITASTNFNHYVQFVKRKEHQLVTHGVYSLCRHPSYVGWFLWSIGTQILLCNPVCLVGYTVVSWRFFKERIEEEEVYLLNFFGEDYIDYQRRVGTGLPFIQGYKGEL